MKIEPIKNAMYKISVPKSNAFKIETPQDCIKLHTITLAVAKRGTGKTVALSFHCMFYFWPVPFQNHTAPPLLFYIEAGVSF